MNPKKVTPPLWILVSPRIKWRQQQYTQRTTGRTRGVAPHLSDIQTISDLEQVKDSTNIAIIITTILTYIYDSAILSTTLCEEEQYLFKLKYLEEITSHFLLNYYQ